MQLKWTICALALMSSTAFAWGERGHDGIARVATRIVADDPDPEIAKFGAFLQRRENMLGHLANVPDIVWRNLSPEQDKLSAPSHFMDLDYILPANGDLPAKAEDFPQTIDAYLKAIDANCKIKDAVCDHGKTPFEKLQKAGHATFRIQTLMEDLVAAYHELKGLEASTDTDKKNAVVYRIILLNGIVAHFIGDLANPHHAATDYDGWNTDQGGLHSYFETEVVDSLPLDLEATVLDEAERHQPMASRFARHPRNAFLLDAWEQILDTRPHLSELLKIDRDQVVTEKSKSATHEKAKRKDVKDTRKFFRNLIVLRLASGADALQRFWINAWEEGGKPDLSFYHSFHYDVKPDLIPLRYLPKP